MSKSNETAGVSTPDEEGSWDPVTVTVDGGVGGKKVSAGEKVSVTLTKALKTGSNEVTSEAAASGT